MKKIILVCGKICSGKSTYTRKLVKELHAVWLSVDEILLSLFGQHLGDRHDEISRRAQNYLFRKSLEIYREDIPVILDFGFWQAKSREEANSFYSVHGITPEWHYVDVDDAVWSRNIKKRNAAIMDNEVDDYYIDEQLAKKFERLFEAPDRTEMDVWYTNDWSE